jgi:hypothetical protein
VAGSGISALLLESEVPADLIEKIVIGGNAGQDRFRIARLDQHIAEGIVQTAQGDHPPRPPLQLDDNRIRRGRDQIDVRVLQRGRYPGGVGTEVIEQVGPVSTGQRIGGREPERHHGCLAHDRGNLERMGEGVVAWRRSLPGNRAAGGEQDRNKEEGAHGSRDRDSRG